MFDARNWRGTSQCDDCLVQPGRLEQLGRPLLPGSTLLGSIAAVRVVGTCGQKRFLLGHVVVVTETSRQGRQRAAVVEGIKVPLRVCARRARLVWWLHSGRRDGMHGHRRDRRDATRFPHVLAHCSLFRSGLATCCSGSPRTGNPWPRREAIYFIHLLRRLCASGVASPCLCKLISQILSRQWRVVARRCAGPSIH